MTNLDSILKSRHYFVNKGPSSQGYGFSTGHVWMWELAYKESWAPKNGCFGTVVLEKTLESPLDCKEIQPVHPTEISPGCSSVGLMLKLKLQYFSHLMRRAASFEKILMLGKIEGRRRRGDRGLHGWMASPTQWTLVWVDFGSWWCYPTISSSVISFSSCFNLSQHQGLFQWVSSSHQVAKVLEFQLQHQSFQWTPRTDLL